MLYGKMAEEYQAGGWYGRESNLIDWKNEQY
jgi:hypothetical protein